MFVVLVYLSNDCVVSLLNNVPFLLHRSKFYIYYQVVIITRYNSVRFLSGEFIRQITFDDGRGVRVHLAVAGDQRLGQDLNTGSNCCSSARVTRAHLLPCPLLTRGGRGQQ